MEKTWPEKVAPFGVIGLDDAVDRIMTQSQRERGSYPGVEPPNVAQVGMVLRALADYTSMQQAVRWAPDPTFDPAATSVCRWMHAYADACRTRWNEENEAAGEVLGTGGGRDPQ